MSCPFTHVAVAPHRIQVPEGQPRAARSQVNPAALATALDARRDLNVSLPTISADRAGDGIDI